jgi:hypothetical protein
MFADPSRYVGLKKFHPPWVPHALLANQKSERISDWKLHLMAPMGYKPTNFKQVITCGESRFFRDYPRDSV